MGWFSKIENPLVRDALDRLLAAVFRPRPVGGEKDRVQEPARLLYARAAGRRCGRSIPIRPSWPARRDAIVGACGQIADTELFQIKGAPTRCWTCSAIPRWWSSTATAASSRCG